MDDILIIFILLIEAITVLQCMQIVFMQKLKIDKYVVGIVLVDIVIYLLINRKIIPFVSVVLVYIFYGLFCFFKFRKRLVETVIRFLVGVALVAGIEGMVSFVTNFFRHEDNSMFILVLSSIITLFLVYLLKWFRESCFEHKGQKINIWKIGIILLYSLLIVGLLIEYYFNQAPISIYMVAACTFLICIFFYIHKLERIQTEIEIKNYELELQQIYGETYEKLLLEVRKRQHDYKNQLATLYGMHLTAQTLEELVCMQRDYGDELRVDSRYDSVLTCCNNPVLAGFIYYRCVECENEDIAVEYNIQIEQAKCCFALHELIEILGILMDNACEYIKEEKGLRQQIKLVFQEDTEKIIFSVSNPAKYLSFQEIEKMFLSGYSSKGENRGIGLARVKELVNKYEAEIKVFNSSQYNEENWICFCIEIEK